MLVENRNFGQKSKSLWHTANLSNSAARHLSDHQQEIFYLEQGLFRNENLRGNTECYDSSLTVNRNTLLTEIIEAFRKDAIF